MQAWKGERPEGRTQGAQGDTKRAENWIATVHTARTVAYQRSDREVVCVCVCV